MVVSYLFYIVSHEMIVTIISSGEKIEWGEKQLAL